MNTNLLPSFAEVQRRVGIFLIPGYVTQAYEDFLASDHGQFCLKCKQETQLINNGKNISNQ